MKNKILTTAGFLGFLCVAACTTITDHDSEPTFTYGLRPVYASQAEAKQIYSEAPRNITSLGKIYSKPPYIYINESGAGVHVIDNSNPADPQPVAFIHISGNRDIAIKGNYLYADNLTDLVTIDISNVQQVQVVNRIADMYPVSQLAYPENYSGSFECVDQSKGNVIGWERVLLEDPKCYR